MILQMCVKMVRYDCKVGEHWPMDEWRSASTIDGVPSVMMSLAEKKQLFCADSKDLAQKVCC